MSSDGIQWARGDGNVAGARGAARAADVGRVLAPNADNWWWHDTCHMHAADVQILSSGSVGGGTGVYWMFYSGGSFEEVDVPAALQVRSATQHAQHARQGCTSGDAGGSVLVRPVPEARGRDSGAGGGRRCRAEGGVAWVAAEESKEQVTLNISASLQPPYPV